MDSHTRNDNLDILISEFGYCLAQPIMLVWIIAIEERGLNDWDIERILLLIKRWWFWCLAHKIAALNTKDAFVRTTLKTCPYSMIQPSCHAFCFHTCLLDGIDDLLCDLLTPHVRILFLIVVGREAMKTLSISVHNHSAQRPPIDPKTKCEGKKGFEHTHISIPLTQPY